ncbi:hypothetical protein [Acidipropionibacterium timonense]|uniref:hypothetical protein n=1 Tax=Acidipropionibacterium timonense TaxID=2161818 RepID=UPI001436A0C1|nr:hypothetical protein [Acidipropionibacterium timonense]
MGRVRSWTTMLLLAVFTLVGALSPIPTADATPPTGKLTLAATLDSKRVVHATGRLTTQVGYAVVGGRISVGLDGQDVTVTTTNSGGAWSVTFTLPVDISAGAHTVSARFDGNDAVGRSAASTTVVLTGTPATRMTARISSSTARPGEVLRLQGTVTLADRTPVSGAEIDSSGSFSHTVDQTTVTAADGSFTALLQVPPDQPGGPITVRVAFAGDGRFTGSSQIFKVTVTAPSPTPTPTVTTTPTPTASPTPESPDGDGRESTPTPIPVVSSTPLTPPGFVASLGGHRALVVVAGIVGGLLALAAVGGGVARIGRRRAGHDDEGPADGNSFFDD